MLRLYSSPGLTLPRTLVPRRGSLHSNLDQLICAFEQLESSGIDAAKGASVATTNVASAGERPNQNAGDLLRIAASQHAINLRIMLTGIAHEQESPPGKLLEQGPDHAHFAGAAEHQQSPQQMIAQPKRPQVKRTGRKTFAH